MNIKQLVKASNVIALIGIALLIYWVFGLILMVVFGLRVFRENLTEMFAMSIMAILAVLIGSLIVNIMLNLTRIADKNQDDQTPLKFGKKLFTGAILMFPLIAGVLFTGDYLSSQKKKQYLIQSAEQLVEYNHASLEMLGEYRFTGTYVNELSERIRLLSNQMQNVGQLVIIVPETVSGTPAYLGFGFPVYNDTGPTTVAPPKSFLDNGDVIAHEEVGADNAITTYYYKKQSYLYKTDLNEKTYLDKVFSQNSDEIYFDAHDGSYQVFYPYQVNGKTVAVLYFSDYMRYGKIGS